jgi:uncharacterized NAD-dependent epimerase/dehydratase family protein
MTQIAEHGQDRYAGATEGPLLLRRPYIIFLGDIENPFDAKTGFGLRDWSGEHCVGQVRLSERAVDLGLPEFPLRDSQGPWSGSLVLGVSPMGGAIEPHWIPTLARAAAGGLDVVSGLHQRLGDIAEVRDAARRSGARLVDVRHSNRRFDVATGRKRTGQRVLTVGTDCAVGKKYTALSLARALRAAGRDADFRATGQTGIMIGGGGIAIDAVVADFIAGAAEALSPDAAPSHWDVVEGQGSLFHPAYAGVSLGLLHGTQPDWIVMCHDPLRSAVDGLPHCRLPTLSEAIQRNLEAARLTNAAVQCLGISLNTSGMTAGSASAVLAAARGETGLPAVDPIRTGVAALLERLDAAT